MEDLQVKAQIEALGGQIDAKITAINQKAEAGEAASKAATAEVQKLVAEYGTMQKEFDAMASELARHKASGIFGQESKMPQQQLEELLSKSSDFASLQRLKKGHAIIEVPEMKATMLTGSNAAGVIVPQQIGGIVAPNLRQTTVLDLLPTAPTISNAIQYVREQSYTSNAAYVAEGGTKPEDDLVLTSETATVKTLATLLRISKQMMDDVPGLVGYITARAPRKLQLVKENNVLFGDGTGENLEGITTVASAFATSAILPSPNRYDVLGAAALQATLAEYVASGVVLHVEDLFLMMHAKDSQGRYLFPEMRDSGTVAGMTIAKTTLAGMKGKFLAGDFNLGAQLFQRQGLTIEMFDQDRDNVQKNLITIRVEERHALATYRPDAFVYGTFAAGITDLTS